MSVKPNQKTQKTMAIMIVISAVIMRLLPHIPNFAPITVGALFGALSPGQTLRLTDPVAGHGRQRLSAALHQSVQPPDS